MVNATLSKLTYTSAFFCSVSTTKFVYMHMCDMFYNIMGWNMLCMLTILYTCILARKKWAQNANCKWCNKACGGVLHLSVITKNICLFALLVCASMFFFRMHVLWWAFLCAFFLSTCDHITEFLRTFVLFVFIKKCCDTRES